jgi:hypothetical protein
LEKIKLNRIQKLLLEINAVLRNAKVILGTRCSLKMSKNMNKRATKRKEKYKGK